MHKNKLLSIYIACLLLFGLFCYLAHRFPTFPSDVTVSLWLQNIDWPFLDTAMGAVSYLGNTISATITVIIVIGILWYFRRRLGALFIAVLTSLASLLNWLLKMLIDRPRPSSELASGSFSFPSGHATYAVVFLGFLFYLTPTLIRYRPLSLALQCILILLILLMAVSRVYLGAHWPSDILGSLFLGGLILTPTIILYNNYTRGRR